MKAASSSFHDFRGAAGKRAAAGALARGTTGKRAAGFIPAVSLTGVWRCAGTTTGGLACTATATGVCGVAAAGACGITTAGGCGFAGSRTASARIGAVACRAGSRSCCR